jgi:uroporphyrinogen decarboxylase
LGNIPPRDVLGQGTPEMVRQHVAAMLASIDDHRRLIISCGGGTPPGAPSENLDALCGT